MTIDKSTASIPELSTEPYGVWRMAYGVWRRKGALSCDSCQRRAPCCLLGLDVIRACVVQMEQRLWDWCV